MVIFHSFLYVYQAGYRGFLSHSYVLTRLDAAAQLGDKGEIRGSQARIGWHSDRFHRFHRWSRSMCWFGTLYIFHNIWDLYGMSSFPLTFIFFRGVGTPPTSVCWFTGGKASTHKFLGPKFARGAFYRKIRYCWWHQMLIYPGFFADVTC